MGGTAQTLLQHTPFLPIDHSGTRTLPPSLSQYREVDTLTLRDASCHSYYDMMPTTTSADTDGHTYTEVTILALVKCYYSVPYLHLTLSLPPCPRPAQQPVCAGGHSFSLEVFTNGRRYRRFPQTAGTPLKSKGRPVNQTNLPTRGL